MTRLRGLGSWLEGPTVPGTPQSHPGMRLGRPAEGPGAIAPFGRRVVALAVDWGLALLIAHAFLRPLGWGQFAPLAVLLAEHALLVGTAGGSVGHRLMRLRVERLDGAAPGLARALVRSLLLCLALPALVWDADQRGMHDRLAGTLIARS